MTLRRDGLRSLAIIGLLSIVLILAACGTGPVTTVPPVSTTEAPTTTLQAATTTTAEAATTTTAEAATTTSEAVTTTTQASTTTTQAETTTTLNPPTITALNPTSGSTSGGTTVVITGTNFVGLSGAGAVTFGGTNAKKYTVNSATKITATAPAHAAGSVQVKVTTPYGASANTAADDFTYVAPPTVTALSPKSGPIAGGTTVVITGTSFVGLSGAGAITFGGIKATGYTVNSATTITATAPAHAAGVVEVKVTTPYGTNSDTDAGDFTYVGPPTLTGLSPTQGRSAGGTSVVLSGTDLTGVTAVAFGGTAATFIIDSNTKITAVAPAHAAGKVRVEISGSTIGGTVNPNAKAYYYLYVDAPSITAIAPSSGPVGGGTKVVITGANFIGVTKVLFGDPKAKYTVDSPTQITAVAPSGSPGQVRVQVTAVGGVSPDGTSSSYTYSFVPGPPVPPQPGWWYKTLELLDQFFAP